ncbi:hypothetical protein AB0I54_14625 [Streptomyces sp. NPDC050625]
MPRCRSGTFVQGGPLPVAVAPVERGLVAGQATVSAATALA